jgi:CDP-glucose 4,6-dehydratase
LGNWKGSLENMVNSSFWKDKQVLITGHTGFKGSWLSFWLHSMGANVIGYSLPPPTHPNLFDILHLADKVTSIIGDVRDFEHLRTVITNYQPTIIFHLAAQPLVRYSYSYPIETYATNVMGTVHLLEAVRQVGQVKVVINVTSDKCYQNREWIWGYRENEPMGGYDPYSSSKGCAELVTTAFQNAFFNTTDFAKQGTALASVRAGNVIGGGDWAEDRLIPDIIRAFMAGQPVIIRHPQAIRPWQHVLEPLSGYLLLAQKLGKNGPQYAEAWNFGPNENDAKPVIWIVDYLTKIWGNNVNWKADIQTKHPHEAHYLKLDCSKAKSKLAWYPKWDIKTALNTTVDWYKAYQQKKDMYLIMVEQIHAYSAME